MPTRSDALRFALPVGTALLAVDQKNGHLRGMDRQPFQQVVDRAAIGQVELFAVESALAERGEQANFDFHCHFSPKTASRSAVGMPDDVQPRRV